MTHHHYTEEEKKWLMDQSPELTYRELTEAFNSHFETNIKTHSISDLMCKRLKAVDRKSNCKKGTFKKGSKPKYPVGAEIEKAGYIWVKINDQYFEGTTTSTDYKKNWKRKAELVWENRFGSIPKDHFLVFLDKNPKNCALENLYLVNRKVHCRMSQNNWYSDNPQFTLCALKYCELLVGLKKEGRA